MNETYGEVSEGVVVKPHQGHQGGMEDDDNLVLWIGNLDSRTTEGMVYELFCQAGPILYIRLPKNPDGQGHKGYCFVTFQHEASVPYAINVMEGTTLYGKKLKLQPRPGSVHRKLMDQKKAEQRQEVFQHPGQVVPVPHPQQQQQQWFAHPQLAQVPPNMFVYQNQLYQSFSPTPNVNMNVMAIPFQPGMGTSFMQIPVSPQGQQAQQPQPLPQGQGQGTMQPPSQRPSAGGGPGGGYVPRTPMQQNGYTTQYMPAAGAMQRQATSPSSHYNSPQVNGQGQGQSAGQYHHQQQHQPRGYQNPRGSRPQHQHQQRNGYANGGQLSAVNNNSRMSYQQQQQRMSTPQQYLNMISPAYQGQTVQLVQSPDYRRGGGGGGTGNQQFPGPQVPGPQQNYGQGVGPGAGAANGYHNVHVYHY